MNRYPTYKSIDLPWLCEIPTHWSVLRNKNIFSEVKDIVGSDSASYTLLSLTLNGIIPRDVESGKGKFPKDFDTYKIVKKGNMAFCLFDIDETPRTVGLSAYDGMLTGAYTIFQVENVNARYAFYYYLSLDNVKAMRPLYSGLRKTINVGTFLGTKFPLPSHEEQDQIVRFLDWKVSTINRLINIKRKEIRTLDAMKRSVVSDAVTHGLDGTVPMKYSGVRWLGDIPAHWSIIKLRQILHPVSVKNHPELPLLSVVREQGVIVRNTQDKEANHNFIPDDLSNYKVVRGGQIVMNKMKAWQGSYGISDYTGIVSPAYFVFDVTFPNLEYLHYAIRSKVYVNFFAQASDGIRIGQWDLQMDKMKEIPFLVPPDDEQIAIVEHIKTAIPQYELAIEKLLSEIRTLGELKTRLISDTVTGKIDVRDIEVPDFRYVEETVDSSDEDDRDMGDASEDEEE